MLAFLSALMLAAQPATAAPLPCTEAEAAETTVVEITSHLDRFLDRCVKVSGAMAGRTLYSGREGMYLLYRFGPDGNLTPEGRRHRVGLDRRDVGPAEQTSIDSPRRVTVIGRVDSCARRSEQAQARARAEGAIILLGGYCHYENGPTIVVDRASVSELPVERITGEAARAGLGNLAFMPLDWPNRSGVEDLVAEFLAALRAGDRATLRELHEFKDEDNPFQQRALHAMLQDANSPFAPLRRGEPAQVAYFVFAAEDGSPLGGERSGGGGTVCFCLASDCSDRWPITFNDIAGAPGRPYVCTKVEPRNYGLRRAVLSTQVGQDWLREPAATAVP